MVKISETISNGQDVYQVSATITSNNAINYVYDTSKTASADSDKFLLNSNTGLVKFIGSSLDYDVKSTYQLYINATDSVTGVIGDATELTIELINITDISDIFNGVPVTVSIFESKTVGSLVTNIKKNSSLTDVVYYLLWNHYSSKFNMNVTTGDLTVAEMLDYEAGTYKYYITVCANVTETQVCDC